MKKSIFQLMLILLLLIVLWYGKSNFESSKEALVLWFETLVPSMLCVMVLVRVIFAYGGLALIAKPFAFFLAKPLNMSRKSFVYVMAMLLLGFPAGAAFINEEVKKGCLHQKEGERLLYACSFATPGFIMISKSVYFCLRFNSSAVWFCFLLRANSRLTQNLSVISKSRCLPAFWHKQSKTVASLCI